MSNLNHSPGSDDALDSKPGDYGRSYPFDYLSLFSRWLSFAIVDR